MPSPKEILLVEIIRDLKKMEEIKLKKKRRKQEDSLEEEEEEEMMMIEEEK